MARKPNYNFERSLRDRAKEEKTAMKAEAKRELREQNRAAALAAQTDPDAPSEDR
jgi:hypothetical protein